MKMPLNNLMFVLFFMVVSLYLSDAGVLPPTLQVCVSYNEPGAFLNAKWNVLDQTKGGKINITYFNMTKMSEGFSITNISLRGLQLESFSIKVESCINTNSGIMHCQRTRPVVEPLYNVRWERISSTSVQFTCLVACRTSIIIGCAVTLISGQEKLFGNSTNVKGSLTAFEPRLVTVIIQNINSDLQYSYSATALLEGRAIAPNMLGGYVSPSTRTTQSSSVQETTITSVFNIAVPNTISSSSGAITTTGSHSEPTSTPGIDSSPSNDGKNQDNSDSTNSQSTILIVVVIVIMAIALPLCVTVAIFIAVLVSRRYFVQASRDAPISMAAPISNDIVTDVDMQENPAYRVVKQACTKNKDTDYYYI